jgi:hypothetical protein
MTCQLWIWLQTLANEKAYYIIIALELWLFAENFSLGQFLCEPFKSALKNFITDWYQQKIDDFMNCQVCCYFK